MTCKRIKYYEHINEIYNSEVNIDLVYMNIFVCLTRESEVNISLVPSLPPTISLWCDNARIHTRSTDVIQMTNTPPLYAFALVTRGKALPDNSRLIDKKPPSQIRMMYITWKSPCIVIIAASTISNRFSGT